MDNLWPDRLATLPSGTGNRLRQLLGQQALIWQPIMAGIYTVAAVCRAAIWYMSPPRQCRRSLTLAAYPLPCTLCTCYGSDTALAVPVAVLVL
jgi:hypothetical protein